MTSLNMTNWSQSCLKQLRLRSRIILDLVHDPKLDLLAHVQAKIDLERFVTPDRRHPIHLNTVKYLIAKLATHVQKSLETVGDNPAQFGLSQAVGTGHRKSLNTLCIGLSLLDTLVWVFVPQQRLQLLPAAAPKLVENPGSAYEVACNILHDDTEFDLDTFINKVSSLKRLVKMILTVNIGGHVGWPGSTRVSKPNPNIIL